MLASDGIFLHGTHESLCHSLDSHLKNGIVENLIVNLPKALDNFRLELFKMVNSDEKNKGESDNMTMIVIKMFNAQNIN